MRNVRVELFYSELIPIEEIILYDLSDWGLYGFYHLFPGAKKLCVLYVGQTSVSFYQRVFAGLSYYRRELRDQITHVRFVKVQLHCDTELSLNDVRMILKKVETDIILRFDPIFNRNIFSTKIPFELTYVEPDEIYVLKRR